MFKLLSLYLLAVVQGVSEVMPISSTGHLVLVKQLFSLNDVDLSVAAALHLGSALAIFIWFYEDWRSLWGSWLRSFPEIKEGLMTGNFRITFMSPETHLPYYLVLSLIPVAIEGFFLQKVAEEVFSSKYAVPVFLMINAGAIMITATRTRGERRLRDLTWYEYLIIGAVQGIAVLPGISRLGLVLCIGLWLGLNWKEAIRLAFLLAVPVIMGALILRYSDFITTLQGLGSIASFGFATLLTVAFSWIGLKFFISRVLERKTLRFFAFYCFTIGSFSLFFLMFWR